ncbi:MAG: bifunctional phosphopantothenoylcysteine decarboxylase/phosphopantothenate--cysteine ligase CoaBC [bacterium]
MSLSTKTIVLGVSGGIAAYKTCDLVRRLREHGAQVHVVMTQAACQFVTPMTFQALSGNPVHTELFDLEQESKIGHIALADLPDLIVVAPATADLIAKTAHGMCNDLLTTLLCATPRPKLFCPSMNVNMWNNPATRDNVALLQKRGFHLMEPATGSLACGYEGAGRLPEPESIVQYIEHFFSEKTLKGTKWMITAGPTWEPLDPVRHITSPASGKTGFALAERAHIKGAEVTLITGPTHLPDPMGVQVIRVQTAEEMAQASFKVFPRMNVAVATAAVSDFRPKVPLSQKAKKENASLRLELSKNQDILAALGKLKRKDQVLVGFAAETEKVEEEALRKLRSKNLDLICANDISRPGLGFASEKNQLTLFTPHGEVKTLPILPKHSLADLLIEAVLEISKEKNQSRRPKALKLK